MELNIFKKCFYCKNEVDINYENFIYYKKKYYHFDCFINEQLNKKRNKLTKEEWIEKAIEIQKEGNEEINSNINREKLFKWLQCNYDIVVIPKYFFVKISNIINGNFQGMSKGIPPEDLLDMWKRKKNELDRINEDNKRKGKVLIGVDRLNYDLAILLSKYDSYLKWKEQQKLLELEQKQATNNLNNNKKIDFNYINKINNNNNSDINISDLLEEVF